MKGKVVTLRHAANSLDADEELSSGSTPAEEGKPLVSRDRRPAEFDYESKIWGENEVGLSPRYLNALRLKYCLQDLEDVHGRVLEVGCGAGGMARAIKTYRPDLDVYGCDISRSAIQTANARSGKVAYSIGDTCDLAFPGDHFASVVMFDVLEHLSEPERAISEISRVLVPGGLFDAYIPCEGEWHNLSGILGKLGWSAKERYAGHIQQFTRKRLQRMFSRVGFQVLRLRWSGHIVYQVIDTVYFGWLSLRGKNSAYTVEGYLSTAPSGVRARILGVVKSIAASGCYLESIYLAKIPGWGVHLTCRKVQ